MATGTSSATGGLVAMIVDEDTATGMLLTGIGHTDLKKNTNFLIVNDSASLYAAGFVVDCWVARPLQVVDVFSFPCRNNSSKYRRCV